MVVSGLYIDIFCAGLLLIFGLLAVKKGRRLPFANILSHFFIVGAILLLGVQITSIWIKIHRPPILHTMAEVKIWYALFFLVWGYLFYLWRKDSWMCGLNLFFALAFISWYSFGLAPSDTNIAPEFLNSWYFPYNVANITAFTLFTNASVLSFKELYTNIIRKKGKSQIIYSHIAFGAGFGLLTLGICFGVLWNLNAFGHYWIWEVSEVWAILTWVVFVFLVHLLFNQQGITRLWVFTLFGLAMVTGWFAINFLPQFAAFLKPGLR